MDYSVWFALIVLFFAGGLTPGPAVMLTVSSSLRYGFRAALLPAMGVSLANLVWISLAAGGVVAIAATVPLLLDLLKVMGVGFILWLAWLMVHSGTRDLRGEGGATPSRARLFASGIGLQLANPNALVFFGLILPSYFDAGSPLLPQVAVIMLSITVTEMFGLSVYAALADALARRFQNPSFALWFNRIAASLMVASVLYALWSTTQL
jgi:threonine/homoserine/homoserine lactone efflux protein